MRSPLGPLATAMPRYAAPTAELSTIKIPWCEGGGGGTVAFQPEIVPSSVANKNIAGLVGATSKLTVGLNATPVTPPPVGLPCIGTSTTRDAGVPVAS